MGLRNKQFALGSTSWLLIKSCKYKVSVDVCSLPDRCNHRRPQFLILLWHAVQSWSGFTRFRLALGKKWLGKKLLSLWMSDNYYRDLFLMKIFLFNFTWNIIKYNIIFDAIKFYNNIQSFYIEICVLARYFCEQIFWKINRGIFFNFL